MVREHDVGVVPPGWERNLFADEWGVAEQASTLLPLEDLDHESVLDNVVEHRLWLDASCVLHPRTAYEVHGFRVSQIGSRT